MTFREFIETKYDVRERINQLRSNPIKDFIDSDIFPCDFVDIENGEMIKMLYYANGTKDIAVLDLLSYRREDLVKLNNKDLLELYDAYTADFEFDGSCLLDLSNLNNIREDSIKNKSRNNS